MTGLLDEKNTDALQKEAEHSSVLEEYGQREAALNAQLSQTQAEMESNRDKLAEYERHQEELRCALDQRDATVQELNEKVASLTGLLDEKNADALQKEAEYSSALEESKERETALNARLSQTQAVIDNNKKQLIGYVQRHEEMRKILDQKDEALQEQETKIKDLTNLLAQKEMQSKQKETDFNIQLSQVQAVLDNNKKQLSGYMHRQEKFQYELAQKEQEVQDLEAKVHDLRNLLDEKEEIKEELLKALNDQQQGLSEDFTVTLKDDFSSEDLKDHHRIVIQYAKLQKEYLDISARLNEEKENNQHIIEENRDLEKQHLEFNARMIELQENLNVEKENLKQAKEALERQRKRNELICSDLKAAAWPYDAEKIQKELAFLLRQEKTKDTAQSFYFLTDFVENLRKRSFVQVPFFVRRVIQQSAQKYKRSYEIALSFDVKSSIDKDILSVLAQIVALLSDNAFRYAMPDKHENLRISFSVKEKGSSLYCSFCDNGNSFDFDKLFTETLSNGLIDSSKSMTQPELLTYLFHSAVKIKENGRGLLKVATLLEKCGGKISADFNGGLTVNFSIPKSYLFDKVFVFANNGQRFALPFNAVCETVFLQDDEFKIRPDDDDEQKGFYYWRGLSIPVLYLNDSDQTVFNYGLVVQAGIFVVLIPIQQVFDTEQFLSFYDDSTGNYPDYLSLCTLLESGKDVLWIDLSKLFENDFIMPPKKIITLEENRKDTLQKTNVLSYLIFKTAPDTLGAAFVKDVLRIEGFSCAEGDAGKDIYETQGKKLPLKDSYPNGGYPYAQFVLVFDTYALAVQEIVDLMEESYSSQAVEEIDYIIYHGKKVPVFFKDQE